MSLQSISAAVERRFFERLSVQLGAGAVDGTLSHESTRQDLESGWALGASTSYRLVDADGFVPFVLPQFDFSFAHATTVERDAPEAPRGVFEIFDVRAGMLAGTRLLGGVLNPYTGARYSGGPLRWRRAGRDETGFDRRRYEIPVGVLVGPVSSNGLGPITAIDGFVEAVVLGQRGATLGVGYGF